MLALCTLSEELNLHPSSLSRVLDFPCQIGGTGERFPDPSFLWVISETRTLILRTKGKWASWGRREQPPTSPQEQITALAEVCRPHEGEAPGSWELHSSYFPLKEVMCSTAGQDQG